mmetsp:Transcript_150764/g.261228  ORF Transcript_150764/g.261228 Transcript_150764/m.261228 type:complete len:220 (-) Transcript_150764:70-729(-)
MKQAGEVEFATILADSWGNPRGCGCVRYSMVEEAQLAVDGLEGSELMGHTITVSAWTGAKPVTRAGGMAMSVADAHAANTRAAEARNKPDPRQFIGCMMNVFQQALALKGIEMPDMSQMMAGKGAGKGSGKSFGKTFGKSFGKSEEMGRKVYVSNLAQGVTWQELKDHMAEAGDVEYVQIYGTSGQVLYRNKEGAEMALAALNGSYLNGEAILVDVWNE